MTVDYRHLLWKYLNIVGEEESVTYWQRRKKEFTSEELEALRQIENAPDLEDVKKGKKQLTWEP